MEFDGYKPFPDRELGGGVNYDDDSQTPQGLAIICRNMRFRRKSPRTRDGYLHTMSYVTGIGLPDLGPFDMTGVEAIDVLVNNPQQVVIASSSHGALLQETPTGSGVLAPLTPPIPLPTSNVSMQTAKAYNRIYMAFSDLMNAKAPPMVVDGPTGVVAPVSQNPIGAIWTPGRYALVGDVVRTSQNPSRWFRCIVPDTQGAQEPSWPVLDGYLSPSATTVANILGVEILTIRLSHSTITSISLTVNSTVGFTVGGSIVVAGVTGGSGINGTFTISAIGTSTVSYTVSSASGPASGGTVSQAAGPGYISNSATITDPNGLSQWIEWTPSAVQFLPQPETPEQVISIKGQAGAPAGNLAAGNDVYICFAYQNANGESAWTQPIVFQNTVASDVIEVFFQQQNEVPGPTTVAAYNAAGYGGPRLPQWLISVLGLTDPVIAWPTINCLNVYVAAVPHGPTAPTLYYQYLSGAPIYAPVIITSAPGPGIATQRITPTASLTKLPFIGAGGSRYLAVGRIDLNESRVPVDPGSPMQFTFLSSVADSGTANVTFIQRSANIVSCTVDVLAGFSQGSQVIISGVTDTSFNGSFTLTGVAPNQYGGATLIWAQTAANGASSKGTASTAGAANAFVTPQVLIATIARSSNVVSAVVNSLQGLNVGAIISVAGVAGTATVFNGTIFAIVSITPNLGGGGTITWAQTAADDTGTGYTGLGVMSPTGAGVGTNAAQLIYFIMRQNGVSTLVNLEPSVMPPPSSFAPGGIFTVAGAVDSSFNGTYTVIASGPYYSKKGAGWFITWNQVGAANVPFESSTGTVTPITGGGPQQGQGNVTAISRTTNTVTATLNSVTNFVLGAQIQVNGVTDVSFNGTFTITSINTGTNQIQWIQQGANGSSSGGQITQTSGGNQQPTPVAILPPGGQFIAEDIAAWSVVGGSQQGPFTFIPAQDPVTPFAATIQTISAVNGAVTALLSNTSGLQAGNTVQVSATTNGGFDGVFVIAQVAGSTVEWAGVGPGTGFSGGTLTLVPTQPTNALGQNNPVAINSFSRLVSGIVSAQIMDVSNLNPGQRIQVVGASVSSFNGQFVVLSVSQNQLPGSATPLTGTVTWQSSTLSVSSATGGFVTGLAGVILDAIDNDLANATDITPQLNTIPVPSSVNVFFSPALNMMVWTLGQDSSHYFSNPGDPANIASPGGILGVNESNGERTRGFVETISGELISLKEKSGYEVTIGSSSPSEWGISRRWFGHGPSGPRAWDTADDFILYFDEDSGPYRYHQGVAVQVGQEQQGTWDRVNKSASAQICVSIDNVRKEVHIGVPLDGATVPNHDMVLNYFNGWEEPLMLTMTGEMMPNPHGRRWSDNDGATKGGSFRLIKVLERTIPTPPSPLILHRQVVFCLSGITQSLGANGYIDMSVPDSFTDNQAAIDWQYQPAFAQSPTLENLVWNKMKLRALGLGALQRLLIQPVTEDPTSADTLAPSTVDLSDGLADSRNISLSEVTNQMFSVIYSGRDEVTGLPVVGAAAELHRSVRYGKVIDSGTTEQ